MLVRRSLLGVDIEIGHMTGGSGLIPAVSTCLLGHGIGTADRLPRKTKREKTESYRLPKNSRMALLKPCG